MSRTRQERDHDHDHDQMRLRVARDQVRADAKGVLARRTAAKEAPMIDG